MIDFSSLQTKVNDLKAKVAQNSITPAYLGALLDDFIVQMKSIDMTGMSDDVKLALSNSKSALENAKSALSKAGSAETSASSALQNALSAIEKANSAMQTAGAANTTANSANSTASDAKKMAANAQDNANIAVGRADSALSRISAIEGKVGSPGGIATLDDKGLIPSTQLPSYVDDVVEFDGISSTPIFQLETASASAPGEILFVTSTNTFFCRGRSAVGEVIKYYPNWAGAEAFGESSPSGRIPASGKIYLDVSTNKQYRWSGSKLVVTGSDLALGETEQTAYSGAKGKQLRTDVDNLSKDVSSLEDTVHQHVADVGILEFVSYVATANDVMNLDTDGVCYATVDKKFVQAGASGPTYPAEYNTFDRIGTCLAPRTDRIFRYGARLYRFDDEEKALVEVGGGSATGNVINIHEITKDWAATNRGAAAGKVPLTLRTGGRKITFMYAAGKWQTWQFTGTLISDWDLDQYWRQEVRSVSINGGVAPEPDREGNVDLTFNVDVDQSMNSDSDNPVANKAVAAAIADVEAIILSLIHI